jgi:hypothetical protein
MSKAKEVGISSGSSQSILAQDLGKQWIATKIHASSSKRSAKAELCQCLTKPFKGNPQPKKRYRYNPEIKQRSFQVKSPTISTPKHHVCSSVKSRLTVFCDIHGSVHHEVILWRTSISIQLFCRVYRQLCSGNVPTFATLDIRFSSAIMLLSILPYMCMSLWLKLARLLSQTLYAHQVFL